MSASSRRPEGARGPLSGIRVLDLSAYIAGPYGCSLLADQGAEVIKIEPPAGDNLRKYPSTLESESRAFLGVNRSKLGLALDLKQPEGLAALKALVANADVLVHNFRPSVPAPTGTWIGPPVSVTSWPRTRPSVVSIAMVRTVDSPRCCATSSTRRLLPLVVVMAFRIAGRWPSNCTSTTAPMTCVMRPVWLAGVAIKLSP